MYRGRRAVPLLIHTGDVDDGGIAMSSAIVCVDLTPTAAIASACVIVQGTGVDGAGVVVDIMASSS